MDSLSLPVRIKTLQTLLASQAVQEGAASLTVIRSPVLEAIYQDALQAASSLASLDQCLAWLDQAWQASAQAPQLVSQGQRETPDVSGQDVSASVLSL